MSNQANADVKFLAVKRSFQRCLLAAQDRMLRDEKVLTW